MSYFHTNFQIGGNQLLLRRSRKREMYCKMVSSKIKYSIYNLQSMNSNNKLWSFSMTPERSGTLGDVLLDNVFKLHTISIINLLLLFGMPSVYPHISTDTLKVARVQL